MNILFSLPSGKVKDCSKVLASSCGISAEIPAVDQFSRFGEVSAMIEKKSERRV